MPIQQYISDYDMTKRTLIELASNSDQHVIIWISGYSRPRILVFVQISSHAISVWIPINYLSLKYATINVHTVQTMLCLINSGKLR